MQVIQSDAIIELSSAQSLTHVTLFVRYWVARDFYRVAVIWAEPNGRGLNFPIYPPSLQIQSTPSHFRVQHDLFTNVTEVFRKPIQPQPTFTNMFGDYPIAHVRFADERAVRHRFSTHLLATDPTNAQTITITNESSVRFQATSPEGRITALKIFDDVETPIKTLEYSYKQQSVVPALTKIISTSPERPIRARLPGSGATVRAGSNTFQVAEVIIPDNTGGRTSEVHFHPFATNSIRYDLPSEIVVRGPAGEILRRARITNVHLRALSLNQIETEAHQLAGFDSSGQLYRRLLDKYWKKQPSDLQSPDAHQIQDLIEKSSQNASPTLGMEIRRLNILMELDRIRGDDNQLRSHYSQYLDALAKAQMWETLLTGGQTAIDTLMIWGRLSAANTLTTEWIKSAANVPDFALLLRFIDRELAKENFWTSLRLLQSVRNLAKGDEQRFELQARECIALRKTLQHLKTAAPSQNEILRAQNNLVLYSSSITALEDQLQRAINSVEQLIQRLPNPSPAQRALRDAAQTPLNQKNP